MDSTKEEAELLFDPKTMRKTRPGLKRLILITSVLFSFISGLPFLLKSIEIYRSPLPFREIDDLSERIELDSLYIPCRFQVVVLGFDGNDGNESVVEKLGFEVLEKMRELNGNDLVCGGCGSNYTVSVTVENEGGNCVSYGDTGFWRCGAVDAFEFGKSDDDELDELLVKGLGGKVYSVVVVNRDEEVRVVVGKYRHAWVTGRVGEMNVVDNVASVFVKFFMKGGKEEGMAQGEFMPVGADGKVVLSFSLLNADPQDWIYDWDFRNIDEIFLAPVVEALGAVANISVESQVLYYTPKSSHSFWDEKLSSYIFSTNDLPFFVNSNEWHLDTSIAAGGRSKILHFVVYILSPITLHVVAVVVELLPPTNTHHPPYFNLQK